MNKKNIESIKEVLCKELDKYAYNGSVSRSDLEELQALTETIKNLGKICMMEEETTSGASARNGSYGSYRMSGNGYSGNGYSGDGYSSKSMSRGYSPMSGRNYSYGNDAEFISQRLETLMESEGMTSDEQNIMRRAMDILRRN